MKNSSKIIVVLLVVLAVLCTGMFILKNRNTTILSNAEPEPSVEIPVETPVETPTDTPCDENSEHGCGIDVATGNIDPSTVEFEVISFDESLEKLNDTNLLFYSFVDCPWCKAAYPYVVQVAKEFPDSQVYYVDVSRDERVDGNSTYDILFEKFSPYLKEELGDDVEKMYIPYFVWVKDGEIVATHTGTIDDAKEMTPEQETAFLDLFRTNFELIN